MAFTRRVGRSIIKRDRFQCQGLSGVCITSRVMDEPFMARVDDGYFLTAAHYPHVHHLTGIGYHDSNARNGRALCILCHSVEEVLRDNTNGARLLLRYGVYHVNHVKEGLVNQWYPDVEDVFSYIEDLSDVLNNYIRSNYPQKVS